MTAQWKSRALQEKPEAEQRLPFIPRMKTWMHWVPVLGRTATVSM